MTYRTATPPARDTPEPVEMVPLYLRALHAVGRAAGAFWDWVDGFAVVLICILGFTSVVVCSLIDDARNADAADQDDRTACLKRGAFVDQERVQDGDGDSWVCLSPTMQVIEIRGAR